MEPVYPFRFLIAAANSGQLTLLQFNSRANDTIIRKYSIIILFFLTILSTAYLKAKAGYPFAQ